MNEATPDVIRQIIAAANAPQLDDRYRRDTGASPHGWRVPGAVSGLGLPHNPPKEPS